MTDDTKTDPQIAELTAQLTAAKAEAERMKGDLGKTRRLLEKFEGVDVEGLRAQAEAASKFAGLDDDLIEEARQLQLAANSEADQRILKERGIDGLIEHRMSASTQQSQKLLEEANARAAELEKTATAMQSAMREKDFKIELSAAVEKFGKFQPGTAGYLANDVRPLLRYTDEGQQYLERDGQRLYSLSDPTRDMSIPEFVEHELPKIAPALLNKPVGVGANGSGDETGENPFVGGTAAEQARLRKENPERAKALAAKAKAAGHKPKISI